MGRQTRVWTDSAWRAHGARYPCRELLRDPPATESRFLCFISTMAAISSAAGRLGPGFPRRFGENSSRYLRFTSARWKAMMVDGLSTMAERSRRVERIRPAQNPPMTRSIGRRFGVLTRDRLRINSWCLSRSDSATTERAPPGRRSLANMAMRWTKRTARSRIQTSCGSAQT